MAVAHRQHLGEEPGGEITHPRDEGGQRREVGLGIARDGHEQDILAARGFDAAARHDAAAVSQQHDLQQYGGVESRGTGLVIAVTGVEGSQVEFGVDQTAQRVFESPRQHLPVEVHRQ